MLILWRRQWVVPHVLPHTLARSARCHAVFRTDRSSRLPAGDRLDEGWRSPFACLTDGRVWAISGPRRHRLATGPLGLAHPEAGPTWGPPPERSPKTGPPFRAAHQGCELPRCHHEVGPVAAAVGTAEPQVDQRHIAVPRVDELLQIASARCWQPFCLAWCAWLRCPLLSETGARRTLGCRLSLPDRAGAPQPSRRGANTSSFGAPANCSAAPAREYNHTSRVFRGGSGRR